MAVAGSEAAIFSPTVRWAPLGSEIPAASLAFKAAWPDDWKFIMNFEDNIGLDTEAEFVDIDTKDRGSIGKIPEGPGSIELSAVSQSVPADLWARLNNFTQVVKAAVEGTSPEMTAMKFDAKSVRGFMLGFEGLAKAGTFFDNDQFIRCILFNAQPSSGGGGGGGRGGGRGGGGGGGGRRGGGGGGRGGGGDSRTLTMGWGGEDSWNKVQIGLEGVAYSGFSGLLDGAGYTPDMVDDEGRMLFVFHALAGSGAGV